MGIYIAIIKQAVLLFPVIAFLFTVPYIVYNYHRYGSVFSMRILIVYSFILYLLCVYFLVILPLPSREFVASLTGPQIQAVPFSFVRDMVKESSFTPANPATYLSLLKNRVLFQVLFNILMTMPFGVYLRYYFCFSLKKSIWCAFFLSLFLELTQLSGLYFYYPRSYRLFDVDDLMANTLGSILGYYAVQPFLGILPARAQMDADSIRRGQVVSLARRMTALCMDFIFAGIFSVMISFFVSSFGAMDFFSVLPFLSFAFYFLFLPVLLQGMTIGKKITKLRIVAADGQDARWYQYLLRYGSVMVVFGLFPFLWVFWMLYAAVKMAQHKRLFYEKLSRTRIVSTISASE